MQVARYIGTVTSVIASTLFFTQRGSASKEINRGNKIIVGGLMAKAAGKAVSDTQRELIAKEMNNTFNSYIVNATNYGASDAAGIAHLTQQKEINKNKTKILIMATLVQVIMNVVAGNILTAIVTMIVCLVTIHYREQELGLTLINMVGITTVTTKVLSILDLILIYYNVRTKLKNTVRTLLELMFILL